MGNSGGIELSRRGLLRIATAGAVIGIFGVAHSISATPASADEESPTRKATDSGSFSERRGGYTDLAGVQKEYAAAIAAFPFSLPAGTSFPLVSRYEDPVGDALWERGIGTSEAFLFWEKTTVQAAHDAYSRGEMQDADRFMDTLMTAYSSPVRAAAVQDADGYLWDSMNDARRGDYRTLVVLAGAA